MQKWPLASPANTRSAGQCGVSTRTAPRSLSALRRDKLDDIARKLAEAGVAATVLPATDLLPMGRAHDHNVPRGVTPAHRMAAHGERSLAPAAHARLRSGTLRPSPDGSLAQQVGIEGSALPLVPSVPDLSA